MTTCPHCHRQRLLASSDHAALGHCLACGDVYDHIDPAIARAESKRKAALLPERYICQGCRRAFTTPDRLAVHTEGHHRAQDSA